MKLRKITATICTLFTIILLASCGTATPEATVDSYMKACISLDAEKMNEFLPTGNTSEIPKDDDTYTNLFKRLKYKIGSSTIDGDTATVQITITALDMKTIMGEMIADLFGQAMSHIGDDSFDSDAYSKNLLSEKMSAEDAPTVTNDAVVNLEKNADGKWVISSEEKNSEFINALTGDLMSIADSLGFDE